MSYSYATVMDEATGRILVLNNGPPGPGGYGIGNSYPQLGSPQVMFDVAYPSTTNPTDFAPALNGVPNANGKVRVVILEDTREGIYHWYQLEFLGAAGTRARQSRGPSFAPKSLF